MDGLGIIPGSGATLADSLARPMAGKGFSASLSAALGGGENRAERDPRDAAEELVAITLVQPILAQLRDSDLGAEPFAATEAEKKFGALYDAEIARRIVSSRSFPLVDALARQMQERSESAGAVSPTGTEAADHDADDRTSNIRYDRYA